MRHLKLFEDFKSEYKYDIPITYNSPEYDGLLSSVESDIRYSTNYNTRKNENAPKEILEICVSWGISIDEYDRFTEMLSWEPSPSEDYFYVITSRLAIGYAKKIYADIHNIDYYDVDYREHIIPLNIKDCYNYGEISHENTYKWLASDDFKSDVEKKIVSMAEKNVEWEEEEDED